MGKSRGTTSGIRSDLFDAFVTVVSLVEIFATSNGSLTALRLSEFSEFFGSSAGGEPQDSEDPPETVANLGNFTFIVFLVVFIYALLGMDLFGNKFHFDDGRPRHNFDTLTGRSCLC